MARLSRNANLGLKTEEAKRALVRYIWESKLKAGDRLPAHEIIRNELGTGNAVVTRALKALQKDGVLVTKRRVGTFVVDPETDGHAGRTIGLIAHRTGSAGAGPFHSCLLQALQARLRLMGCQTMVFYSKLSDWTYQEELEHFPGLRRSVEDNILDAVILTADLEPKAWNWLEERGKHPCFVGAPTYAPTAVFMDYAEMIRIALDGFQQKGCRRPAVAVGPGLIRDFVWPEFCRLTHELPEFDPQRFYFSGVGIPGGHQIARELLSRPSAERPDGLAILDDHIGIGLLCGLIRAQMKGEDYRPQLYCQINKQTPFDFPVDDIVFIEVDIDVLAREAVHLTMDSLTSKQGSQKKIWIKPKLVRRPLDWHQEENSRQSGATADVVPAIGMMEKRLGARV